MMIDKAIDYLNRLRTEYKTTSDAQRRLEIKEIGKRVRKTVDMLKKTGRTEEEKDLEAERIIKDLSKE